MSASNAPAGKTVVIPDPAVTANPRSAALESNRTLHWVLWSVLVLVIGGLTANFVRQQWRGMQRRDITKMEQFNAVPDFSLTERNGQPFGTGQLKGKIWLANFFFTACPGPCLRMNTKMGEIQQALIRDRADVQMVSFSINPAQDTPEVLRPYAEHFKAQPGRWMFLTGARDVIYDVAKRGFMLPTMEAPLGDDGKPSKDGEFIHSTKIALVDRQGIVRRYYDSENGELTQHVLSDIGSLMREQPASSKTNAAAALTPGTPGT